MSPSLSLSRMSLSLSLSLSLTGLSLASSPARAVSGLKKGHSEQCYAEIQLLKFKDLVGMESLKIMEKIRNKEESGLDNLCNLDLGKARNREFATPQISHGFLRTWPGYSLPLQASKTNRIEKEESMREVKARILAGYSPIPENCNGNKCHCRREWESSRNKI